MLPVALPLRLGFKPAIGQQVFGAKFLVAAFLAAAYFAVAHNKAADAALRIMALCRLWTCLWFYNFFVYGRKSQKRFSKTASKKAPKKLSEILRI